MKTLILFILAAATAFAATVADRVDTLESGWRQAIDGLANPTRKAKDAAMTAYLTAHTAEINALADHILQVPENKQGFVAAIKGYLDNGPATEPWTQSVELLKTYCPSEYYSRCADVEEVTQYALTDDPRAGAIWNAARRLNAPQLIEIYAMAHLGKGMLWHHYQMWWRKYVAGLPLAEAREAIDAELRGVKSLTVTNPNTIKVRDAWLKDLREMQLIYRDMQ